MLFLLYYEGTTTQLNVQIPTWKSTSTTAISGPWHVHFQKDRGAPEKAINFENLASFTTSSDNGIKYFSGTATYINAFEISAINKNEKIITLVFGLTFSVNSFSQITIGTGDFAVGGDTLRLSIANIVPSSTALTTNGANALWDYSALVPTSQDIDTFLAVTSTGITYSVYFANFPFNTK